MPASGTLNTSYPNARFNMVGRDDLDNSVALVSIDSPNNNGAVLGNTPTPISVTIRNKGKNDLDSCLIEWSLNKQYKSATKYYGKLSEDFLDTITLGSYLPVIGKKDTIVVWVSFPNGKKDSTSKDDTITIMPTGCASIVSGNVNVGLGEDIPTIISALNTIRTCGVAGDVTLLLKGTFPENVDLTGMENYMNGYSLTITSYDGNKESASIKPNSGMGITLGRTPNLVIKDITIDVTASASNGIQFTGGCTNVVIRGCKILVNPTSTASACNPIYKGNTEMVDSIFFIGNTLDGGYAGFNFTGGNTSGYAGTGYGTHVVFDSNTVSNNSHYGTLTTAVDFTSCSYNTILSRTGTSNINATWMGLSMEAIYGPMVGNHIIQRTNSITQPRGIYLYYHNNYYVTLPPQNKRIVANNEIILNTTTTSAGIYVNYSSSEIINNSIYISGTGAARGIYFENPSGKPVTINNNNIVLTNASAHPIYFNSTNNLGWYAIDYNNYDAPNYIGFCSSAISTMTAWQQQFPNDLHSVKVSPVFIDKTEQLSLKYNVGITCPIWGTLTEDIQGTTRRTFTTMGAYEVTPTGQDMMLLQMSEWNNEIVKGQIVSVKVDVVNIGAVPITDARLSWSVNGQRQDSVLWTANPTLTALEQQTIYVGSFEASGANAFEVLIWTDSINGQADTVRWNDSIRASSPVILLTEFVAPFVQDTINSLNFKVNARISPVSGAPALLSSSSPQLILVTHINNRYTLHDTLPMTLNNGIWTANVPQQYYNSQVIYSLTVSDTTGVTLTIMDSTYIQYKESAFSPYAGHNLAMMKMFSPVNADVLCMPNYSSVEVVVANLGNEDYDYTQSPVTLAVEVINSRGMINTATVVKNMGVLLSGESETIGLIPALPIMYAGTYHIKAWLKSAIDSIFYDDTLYYEFEPGRITLPVDEDFSDTVLSSQFLSIPIVGTEVWQPYMDTAGLIFPPEGDGMLRYAGAAGLMSVLTTRQLDLTGVVDPYLNFWYYHDATTSDLDRTYTEVNIIIDGIPVTNRTLYKKDDTTGWRQYTVDLAPYMNNQCILIQFESMNIFSMQYLGHITITSTPDLAVSSIIISPEITICDKDKQDLSVVIATVVNQAIDFGRDTTSLVVEMPDTTFIIPLQNIIAGNISDTILIAKDINIKKSVYNIRAYVRSPVDNYSLNDTAIYAVDIRPKISIHVEPLSIPNSLLIGTDIYQMASVKNEGNIALSGIDFVMLIDTGDVNPAHYVTVREHYAGTISEGDSITYIFTNAYKVPYTTTCYLRVTAYLSCDSSIANATTILTEDVDVHDLILTDVDIISSDSTKDIAGSTGEILVNITNASNIRIFSAVNITAIIEDGEGQTLFGYLGTIPSITPLRSIQYMFPETYTIPDDSVYYIRVFINSVDNYSHNDTIRVKRTIIPANDVKTLNGENAFSLAQNIPNPATNTTRIDYSIPEAGEIVFHVRSVSGQLLYSQIIEASSGKHSFEFNTHTLAAGIYIYSIEYKGQRLIKRMSVQK
jgi:hypothetical protein